MIQISRLSENLIFEILNKLEVVPLVRMRQTCKRVDTVSDKYRRKLASRPCLGIDVIIEDYLDPDKKHFFIIIRRNQDSPLLAMYEKQLSAISLRTIQVAINFGRDYELLVIELFKRIQPTCKKLNITNFSPDLVLPLANSVTFLDALEVHLPNQLDADTILAMNQSPNRSKFRLYCFGEINEGIFEKVQNFQHVDILTNKDGYDQFLFDIRQSTEKITLKSIKVSLDDDIDDDSPQEMIVLPFQYALIWPDLDMEEYVSVITIFFMEKSALDGENIILPIYDYDEDMEDEMHDWISSWLEKKK